MSISARGRHHRVRFATLELIHIDFMSFCHFTLGIGSFITSSNYGIAFSRRRSPGVYANPRQPVNLLFAKATIPISVSVYPANIPAPTDPQAFSRITYFIKPSLLIG